MAFSNVPTFVVTPKLGLIVLATADTTNPVMIFSAGANGAKVVSVTVASSDSAARTIKLTVTRGGAAFVLTTVSVPAGSGTNGAAASVDLLRGGPSTLFPGLPLDNDGQAYLFLQTGDTLTCNMTTTITAGLLVYVSCVAGDF